MGIGIYTGTKTDGMVFERMGSTLGQGHGSFLPLSIFYPAVFGLACLILWKQMSSGDLEARLMNGGLSKIPPAALINFLRIYMLRLHEFGWMTGDLIQNIPQITSEEWTVIFANCNEEQRTTLINLY